MQINVYNGKELECMTCDHKIVCKFFKDMAMAWNVREAVMRGRCKYYKEK